MKNRSIRIRIAAGLVGLAALGAVGLTGTSPAQASTFPGISNIVISLPKVPTLQVTAVTIRTGVAGPRPTVTSTTAPGTPEVPMLISHEMIEVCATAKNTGTVASTQTTMTLGTHGPALTTLARPITMIALPPGVAMTSCTQMIMGDYDYLGGCPAYQKPTPWDFDVSVPVRAGSTTLSHAYSSDFAIWGGCNDPSYR